MKKLHFLILTIVICVLTTSAFARIFMPTVFTANGFSSGKYITGKYRGYTRQWRRYVPNYQIGVDIACDDDGYTYLVSGQHVQKYRTDGQLVKNWGGFGSEYLVNIQHIALLPNGKSIVVDWGCEKGRITVYSSDNNILAVTNAVDILGASWNSYGVTGGKDNNFYFYSSSYPAKRVSPNLSSIEELGWQYRYSWRQAPQISENGTVYLWQNERAIVYNQSGIYNKTLYFTNAPYSSYWEGSFIVEGNDIWYRNYKRYGNYPNYYYTNYLSHYDLNGVWQETKTDTCNFYGYWWGNTLIKVDGNKYWYINYNQRYLYEINVDSNNYTTSYLPGDRYKALASSFDYVTFTGNSIQKYIHSASASGQHSWTLSDTITKSEYVGGMFNNPSGILINNNDNLIITDTDNHKMRVFDLDGTHIKDIESENVSGKFFSGKYGCFIAQDLVGNYYVTSEHFVQKYDSNWKYITHWGCDHNMIDPYDVAVYNNIAYVFEPKNNCISLQDTASGNYTGKWDIISLTAIYNFWTSRIAAGSQGVYLSSDKKAFRFDLSGNLADSWSFSDNVALASDENYSDIKGICVAPDNTVYMPGEISTNGHFKTSFVDKVQADGTFIKRIFLTNSINLSSRAPLTVNSDGSFYIRNGSSSILHIDGNGNIINTISGLDVGNDFVILNSDKIAYINRPQDGSGPLIHIISTNGNVLAEWGKHGRVPGQPFMYYQKGIDTDGTDLYIADSGNSRLLRFTEQGSNIWIAPNDNLKYPSGIVVDDNNIVYVADTENMRVRKYTTEGTHLGDIKAPFVSGKYEIGRYISGRYGVDLALDDNGSLFITSDQCVMKYAKNGDYLGYWNNIFMQPPMLTNVIDKANAKRYSGGYFSGRFSTPTGVAEDKDGNVFVVDPVNGYVMKYTSISAGGIENKGPVLNGGGDFTVPVGKTVSIIVEAEDSDSSWVELTCTTQRAPGSTFTVETLPDGMLRGTFSWTPAESDSGTNGIQFIAKDSLGGTDKNISIIDVSGLMEPINVIASDGAYVDKITVEWSAVPGATKYNIYRNTNNKTNAAIKISGDVTGLNYNDLSVTPGIMYYYWVKAGGNESWSELSTNDSGYAQLTQPVNISATDGAYNDKVVVIWSNVVGAVEYNIYRGKTNNAALATLLGTSTNNIYSDTTVTPGVKNYYWIKALAEVGDSEFSNSDSGFAFISQDKPIVNGKWKYKSKNGKAKLNIKGLDMETPLANYLEAGYLVGLKDATTYKTVDGPRELKPKPKKNGDIKFWFYKKKKDAVIKYKPNDKKPNKDKLIYKVWEPLPAKIIFFVQPPQPDENVDVSDSQILIKPVYELYLSPGAKMKNGWRELITE